MLEDEYKSLVFENEHFKSNLDSAKLEIKRLEASIKSLEEKNETLDKENDELEERLLKSALNKLSPQEIFRHRHVFENAGIKLEGKVKIDYENMLKKNRKAISELNNETNQRLTNIYKEDVKSRGWQTDIWGTYGNLVRIDSTVTVSFILIFIDL